MVGPEPRSEARVKKRDGAIIDLAGVDKHAERLLVWGEAVDVDLLKTLPKLETLEVYKIRAKDLPKVQRLGELPLTGLSLRFWSEPDLTAFRPPPGLTGLTIWQSNKLVSLEGVEAATGLEYLQLNDNGRLQSLAPILALPNLTALYLTGGIWTKQATDGFAALDGLETLRRLQLRGIDGRGLDLTPVARLPNLEWLDIWARDFAMEEVAKVAAAHPFVLKQLLDLEDYGLRDSYGICDRCEAMRKVMFLKGRKFLWCPVCDKAGIERLLKTFLAAVEQARQDLGLPKPA